MENKNKIYGGLPQEVKTVLIISEGWLVGSAPAKVMNGDNPRDYDVMVEDPHLFSKVIVHLKDTATCKLNTFGGIKATTISGVSMDIWCETLDHFVSHASKYEYLYKLRQGILLKAE